MKRNLPSNSIIIDSGANIGQMSLYFGTDFPNARILAFEPGQYQADWLLECLARNPQLQITLYRQGLGDVARTMYLQPVGHSCSHGGQNIVTEKMTGEPIEVVTLSKILALEKIDKVDLWKLDVEGFEIPALNGAAKWLEAKRIRALWVETMGENGDRVVELMRTLDYRAFKLNGRGDPIPIENHEGSNTLFLPA